MCATRERTKGLYHLGKVSSSVLATFKAIFYNMEIYVPCFFCVYLQLQGLLIMPVLLVRW